MRCFQTFQVCKQGTHDIAMKRVSITTLTDKVDTWVNVDHSIRIYTNLELLYGEGNTMLSTSDTQAISNTSRALSVHFLHKTYVRNPKPYRQCESATSHSWTLITKKLPQNFICAGKGANQTNLQLFQTAFFQQNKPTFPTNIHYTSWKYSTGGSHRYRSAGQKIRQ